MKTKLLLFGIAVCMECVTLQAQNDWTAYVTMDINHSNYAYEQYTGGTITFSGSTQTVPSTTAGTSGTYFTFQGSGSPDFSINANVSGIASFPYNIADPPTLSLSVSYTATSVPFNYCETKNFYKTTSSGDITIYITVYPRMVINTPNPVTDISCASVTLSTSTCSSWYSWQVRDDGSSTWQSISKNTASITMTPDELLAVGLASKYGKKFFRVTGQSGTTSQEEPVNVFYNGPSVTATVIQPNCTGYTGGVQVDIVSSLPGTITNFVGKLYLMSNPSASIDQIDDIADYSDVFTGVAQAPASTYFVRIQNNSAAGVYGSCYTDVVVGDAFINPPPVTLSLNPTLRNGFAISCGGGSNSSLLSDGIITGTPGGGSGTYTEYTWTGTGAVGGGAVVSGLAPGPYSAKVKDSKECWSPVMPITLAAPQALSVTAVSQGGSGGYDVTCHNNPNGEVRANVTGGITSPVPSFAWSNSSFTGSVQPNLGPGTYIVYVTDANGCQTSDDIGLSAPPTIDFDITQLTSLNCPGDKTTLAVQNLVNVIGSPHYAWSPSGNSDELPNVGFGNYSVTVSDDQGCSTTKSKPVADPVGFTVELIPVAAHNGKYISCDGEDDGSFNTLVKDQSGTVATATSYSWSREGVPISGAAASLSGLNKGNYTVTIGYGVGCSTSDTEFIDDPDPVVPLVSVSSTSLHNGLHISCPGQSDGSLHATASGGTPWDSPLPAYTFLWDTGSSGSDIAGKSAGTYMVTATDHNGCKGLASGTLIDPPPINPTISFALTYNGLHVKCHDDANGKLDANATGGGGTLSYLWSRGDNSSQLLNVAPGDYTVTISDANGCTETSAVKSVVNPPAVVTTATIFSNYNNQPIKCAGGSDGWIKASATGGTNSFSYSWNTGASGPDLTGIPAGTYTATAVDQNGCSATDSKILIDPTPVVASIAAYSDYNGFNISCSGENDGFLEVAGSGGAGSYTYLWSPTNETTFRISSVPAGPYQVTVADVNGCFDVESFTLLEPGPLSVSIANVVDVLCFGDHTGSFDAVATGGTGGSYEYSLSATDWLTTSAFSQLEAATAFTVSVRDGNQCIASVVQTLSQPPPLDIAFANEPAFCADPRGSSVASVTGGVGAYSYQWSNSSSAMLGNTNTIVNQRGGVYTLQITDGNGCDLTEDTGIVTTDGPQADIVNLISTSCSYTSDGSATLNVFAGAGPFTFLWQDGQTNATGSGLAGGVYQVTIRDANDCPTAKEVIIPSPAVLDIAALESIVPNCFGDCNGKISVQSTGGTSPYTFNWGNQAGPLATGLCAGTYSVSVLDSQSCTLTEQFNLGQPQVLDVQMVDRTLPLCKSDCNGSIQVVATGGNSNYQYQWSSGATNSMATALCAGNYTVTVTDSKNCFVESSYSLGEPTRLELREVGNQPPVCHDGCNGLISTQAIGGTGSYSYLWSTSASAPQINNLCPGNYTVTARDANNCVATATYTVENPARLEVNLGGAVTLCVGQSHVLDAGPQWVSYLWKSNVGFTANTQAVIIEEPGQYWVDLTNQQGCLAQDTFLLETSLDLLQANMIMASTATVGDTVVIVDVSWPLPDNIVWEFPPAMERVVDLGEVVLGKFTETGTHAVRLMTRLGQCYDEMSRTITILETDDSSDGGRLGYESFVKEFIIYPNPTDGNFEVSVELAEESPITLSIWSTMTGHNIVKATDSDKKYYTLRFDLRPLASGPYVLRLDHQRGHQSIRFVVH